MLTHSAQSSDKGQSPEQGLCTARMQGILRRTVRCSCAWICCGMAVVVPYRRRTVTLTRELPASLQEQRWHHLGPQHLLAAWLASPAVSSARSRRTRPVHESTA